MYKITFLSFLLFFTTTAVLAHQPELPQPTSSSDQISITKPEISRAFYSELTGYPHTYVIDTKEAFDFYVQVLEPDIEGVQKNHGVIVVQQVQRGVEEVARLKARDASWESFHEPFGNDDYLQGGEYEARLEAGSYLIEVSSPDNTGKYSLAVGKIEDFSDVGYFQTIKRMYKVKQWFGKPGLAVVFSPLVYGPLLVIIFIVVVAWWIRRKYFSHA